MKRFIRTSLAAVLMATVSACASGGADMNDMVEMSEATVLVNNNHFNDVTVDVVTDAGTDYRLGTVTAADQQAFELPEGATTWDVRFLIDPLGSSQTHLTDDITVPNGGSVQVDVQSNLDLTSVSIRPRSTR